MMLQKIMIANVWKILRETSMIEFVLVNMQVIQTTNFTRLHTIFPKCGYFKKSILRKIFMVHQRFNKVMAGSW